MQASFPLRIIYLGLVPYLLGRTSLVSRPEGPFHNSRSKPVLLGLFLSSKRQHLVPQSYNLWRGRLKKANVGSRDKKSVSLKVRRC